jgi:hypothetical protein
MRKIPENFQKHFESSRNKQFLILVLCLSFSEIFSFPQFSLTDGFSLFSWTRKDTSSYNYGYNLIATAKSQQQIGSKLVVGATVQVPGLPDWLTTDDSIEITFVNSSPANIINSSPIYKTCAWLQKIRLSRSYKGVDSLYFTFPVPDQNSPYRKYDYFTIAINDSIHLQYQGVEDTIFMGSFLNHKRRNEPDKWLVAKGAIMVRVSNAAPFKIQNIQINREYEELVAQYLKCDLYSKLDAECDYFGIDFMGSTTAIKVSNVKINADTLIADSTYNITWTTGEKDAVESCSIYVSFNDNSEWFPQPLNNIDYLVKSETYSWNVPKQIKACKFKVVVTGNGQIASGTSALYPVKVLSEPSVSDSEVVNNYTLNAIIKSDTVYLSWSDLTSAYSAGDSVGILKCGYQFIEHNDPGVELVRMFPVTASSFALPNPESLCYLGLLVRNKEGKWSKTTSRSIVSVGKKLFDTVTITSSDTHSLFNNTLRVWNTSNNTFTDTVEQWNGPLDGFISISSGFSFKNGDKIPLPLWFQVPYLKSSFNPADIRLYSFDINKGGWIVSRDSVIVDTVKGLVSARNSSPGLPFMFLIDTLKPLISFLDSSKVPVKSGQRIHYNITVTDNVKNCSWKFVAGTGEERPLDLSFYVDTSSKSQTLGVTVPQVIVDGCTGFRALFTISDMVHENTVDLGRPVIRENWNCDNISTDTMQWTPVLVSANLDKPELKSVMAFSSGKENWSYNTEEMRIIKWIPGHQKAFNGGWVEYSESENSLFQIKPGELLWIKTKERFNLDFGRAVVPKLNAVDTINLPPSQWTDFSNPFPFDIYLGDIFETTSNSQIDSSIRVYSWDKDSLNRSYNTNLLYINGLSGHGEPNASIKKLQSYTVFNNANVPVSLLIPAISTEASAFVNTKRSLPKKENNSHWSLSIKSWGSDNINNASVYLGENSALSKEITSPLSPSFSSQSISIYDKNRKKTWGVVVSPKESESGNYFEVLFENSASNAATVRTVIGEMFNIEQSHFIRWYDTEKDIWISAQDTMEVSLKPKQRLVKIIAIGNEQYFRDLGSIVRRNVLALRAVYPNPFARAFTIQYSLPYEARKVTFLVFDLLGKVVWQRDINDIHPGPSMIRVDKMMATGLYVLQMRVIMDDQGSPKVLNRRVMCVR